MKTENLTRMQIKLLEILMERYEDSVTYKGEAKTRQSFREKPEGIFPRYRSDWTDPGLVRDFEEEMTGLERRGWIRVNWMKDRREIRNLELVQEKVPEIRAALHWKEKNQRLQEEEDFYRSRLGWSEVTDRFIRDQLERLAAGKKPAFPEEEAEWILALLRFLLENWEDMLERELSIEVLHHSKLFGQHYRKKICRLLRKYGGYQEPDDKALLEQFHIFQNPGYIFMKGAAEIRLKNGTVYRLDPACEMAFGESLLEKDPEICLSEQVKNVVTVENLTSFHRMTGADCFYIYLSGYHSTLKTRFLCLLREQNPEKKWLHFGDMDPDGFLIFENLRNKTGIPFETVDMDIRTAERYRMYGNPLERQDRIKAGNLMEAGLHKEILQWMLDQNRKIEQEIISWKQQGRL